MEKTIRLYTRQNEKTLLMLEHSGRIFNQRTYVMLHFGDMAQHYLDCYDWFAEEAARHVPKPKGAELSIWCVPSAQHCLPPVEGTVVYVVDAPADQIVFFDEVKWDYVLNHRYLPADDADEQAYRKHLRDIGAVSSFEFFEGRYQGKFPEETARIRESWKRVFDPVALDSPTVCGNLWEIKREWIVRIVRPGQQVAEEEGGDLPR